jgi:hypothetical protein
VSVRLSGDLPEGAGLSSSSALIVALGTALADANNAADDDQWSRAISNSLARAEYFAAIETGAGAQIDRAVAGMQRSVGEFSLRAGHGVDQAGRSVGTAAQQVGTGLHDRLVAPVASDASRAPAVPDGTVRAAEWSLPTTAGSAPGERERAGGVQTRGDCLSAPGARRR